MKSANVAKSIYAIRTEKYHLCSDMFNIVGYNVEQEEVERLCFTRLPNEEGLPLLNQYIYSWLNATEDQIELMLVGRLC